MKNTKAWALQLPVGKRKRDVLDLLEAHGVDLEDPFFDLTELEWMTDADVKRTVADGSFLEGFRFDRTIVSSTNSKGAQCILSTS